MIAGPLTAVLTFTVAFWGKDPSPTGICVGCGIGLLIGLLVGFSVARFLRPTRLASAIALLITIALAWIFSVVAILSFSIVFFAAPDEIYYQLFNRPEN